MTNRSALLHRSLRKDYPVAVRGEGAWIIGAHDKRFLDLAGSAAVNFIGHGDQSIAEAMREQLAQLEFVHSSQFTTEVAEEFAREIIEFAGSAFAGGAVFFTSGGSEAVETALKLARQYQVEIGQQQRTRILSRHQSYHGSTFGAMAVSGNRKRREIFLPMMPSCSKVGTPYCYRCLYGCDDCSAKYVSEVERELGTNGRETAAFIFEPISGATLGAVIPPEGYLQSVAAICESHGLLVIADEVMTGFGRTGANFAVDHWSVAPDLLVVGKGIASGYAPLGAVIASSKVVEALSAGSGALVHGFTYNAHPVSVSAGRAVLARIREQHLVRNANSTYLNTAANHLKSALAALSDCASVGDVRGTGLLWGIEFVADKASREPFASALDFAAQVSAAALRRGLIAYPMQGCVDGISGDHLLLAPPAVISEDEIVWSVELLRDAIEETEMNVLANPVGEITR